MSSGLIIVVDDNPSFRKIYSDFLSVHGYTVMTAKSGSESLKMLLNCTPKALILDISMPRMDGIETCKQIRRMHGHDIPIIFLTSFTDINKLRNCLLAGGDDYLIKSESLDNILGRVRFWSAAPNRQEARLRRAEVVSEVDNAIERIEKAASISATGMEEDAGGMSRLMATAQALADAEELTDEDNKLYVIGYATGIVDHWAETRIGVKPRYEEYLRAALAGSYLLSRKDIAEALDDFARISGDPAFVLGRKRAEADCEGGDNAYGDPIAINDGMAEPLPAPPA